MNLGIKLIAFIFLVSNFEKNKNFFIYAETESKSESCPAQVSSPAEVQKLLTDFDENLSRCGNQSLDIRELTIERVQKYFVNGELSSEELTECYLKRIHAMNPYLKAMIELNPDARKIAKEKDTERKEGQGLLGPLHGISILVKDNIATDDKMQTTAGSLAMLWVKPKTDAQLIQKLRAAGVVIIGKTNPAEWAYFRGTNIKPGWSGRGGQTLNPYNLAFDPSESSTGSAVATAANLGMVALGTETDGSIITPSSVQGIVGLKPTLGCVSTDGVIPIAFTQDVIGPMTRTTQDALILFNAIANDECKLQDLDLKKNYEEEKPHFKIGVLRDPFWDTSDPLLSKHVPKLEIALEHLKNSGRVTLIDPVVGNSEIYKKVTVANELVVLYHEFKDGLNKYLEYYVTHLEVNHGRKRMSHLSDIIQFNIENPNPEGYNQELLLESEATDGLLNSTYLVARTQNQKYAREYVDAILNGPHGKLDAIAAPCYMGNRDLLTKFHSVGAVAGYPHIAVPGGFADDGVPIGLCFGGGPNSEATLLKIAYLVEQVYSQRSKPKFLGSP